MARRLTLVSPSLALGGAERVISSMANHWSQNGADVTLITLDSPETDTYELSPQVNRIALGLMQESRGLGQAIVANWRRCRRLRRAIQAGDARGQAGDARGQAGDAGRRVSTIVNRQSSIDNRPRPQTVISFTDRMNVVTLLACLGLHVDVVVSERIDPARHDIGRIWSLLRRLVYPRCRALVVQTEQARRQMLGIVKHKPIYVIPNAAGVPNQVCHGSVSRASSVQADHTAHRAVAPGKPKSAGHRIVAMGRLDPQKGFDLLIDAFSRIAAEHGDWTLEILGEGPQRGELERLIEEHRLQDRATLAGWIADPAGVLRRADLFVLSSRYEGFPNALLEAMACGLPVVSFDCPSGPAEIVRHEIDGLLVPADDVDALSTAVERLISNPDERKRLAERAPEVLQRFSTERFFAQWDAVLAIDN